MREWAEGVSVYDDFDRACAVAKKFGFRAGSYVVRLLVPNDADLEIMQTFDDPHHFTIYAPPDVVFALVIGETIFIRGAPGG